MIALSQISRELGVARFPASRCVRKNNFTCTPCMYSREENKPMATSQERQPTLDFIAPRSLARDMEQALAFYGRLGFVTTYHEDGFAIVERDGVALHFNASDSDEPPHDSLLGWISVSNIE